MKKIILLLPLLAMSCSRSMSQVWEDTKTAASFMFFGSKTKSELAANEEAFHISENDFIPFDDKDLNDEKMMQSKHEPGMGVVPTRSEFVSPSHHLQHIFSNIHFDVSNYDLKGNENKNALSQMVDYLKAHKEIYLFIEGHCDERGVAQYNYSLGAKRANAVRNYLIKNGISQNRIFTVSCGKDHPLDYGHNQKAWQKNRRTQFKIYQP
jgi:peptidoglycan-associated lipoprotein